MSLTTGTYQAARIGADVKAGVAGSAGTIATRAQNKFVGRAAAGAMTGGKLGRTAHGGRMPSVLAVGAGAAAGLLPGRAKLTAGLYRLSRKLNDLDTLISADVTRMGKRYRHKLTGRYSLSKIYKKASFRGKEAMLSRFSAWRTEQIHSVENLCKAYSMRMEQYAKANAPWIDRTGAAREGLTGYTRTDENWRFVGIAHTVEYGRALEQDFHGEYAILKPTRDRFAPRFVNDLNQLMRRGDIDTGEPAS